MAETLIVLGNGFDLDLGWKTSYSDFYNAKRKDFDIINRLPYIEDMIKGKHWYNLEGYIRQCILSLSEDKMKILNDFWQVCRDYLFGYLTHPSNHSIIYTTNKCGCAYALLTAIRNSSIASFNYTNPFYLNELDEYEILHVHGKLEDGAYKTKLGVDSNVKYIGELSNEDKIKCMIKSNNNDNVHKFHSMLKKAYNVIIYGHSLGITDSDYFKSYFEDIITGKIYDKNIYIVTYNKASLQDIVDNMRAYGIDYTKLISASVNLIPIFTSKGKEDLDFCHMMENVTL